MTSKKGSDNTARVIRASEIGQYKYCARAWWLASVLGLPSANTREMAQGDAFHQQHGRGVWSASMLRVLAFLLMIAAIVLLLIAFIT